MVMVDVGNSKIQTDYSNLSRLRWCESWWPPGVLSAFNRLTERFIKIDIINIDVLTSSEPQKITKTVSVIGS